MGGSEPVRVSRVHNSRISSFQHLYDLFVLPTAEITNREIQGQLRRVILLLIAQTSHECYLLSISKTVVVFPPHNLWLYEGQRFSLSFLPKTSEQVDADNDALLEPRACVDWSILPPAVILLPLKHSSAILNTTDCFFSPHLALISQSISIELLCGGLSG